MTNSYFPRPVDVKINMATGELDSPDSAYDRKLSQMYTMYEDQEAAQKLLGADPVIYKVYEKKLPELPGELQWCMSVTLPGKVGREYYMTKGHYHSVRETAEIYLCVAGEGYMLMETEQGDVEIKEMRPNTCVYVPAYWAHRSINTGGEPLISFCVYPGHAGHDYGSIETKGFKKRVVEIDGKPVIIDV
ncbi:MAG: glucose-6-phosphate isomerase [Planctomycetaceae bacterium]|nr:glucose-6-phosphate isomerase [Planctomycetaceae bacterium]